MDVTAAQNDAAPPPRCPHLAGYRPLAPAELRDPYPTWARARAEAPVFWNDELQLWSVTRLDDVLAVARDAKTFSSAGMVHLRQPVFPDEVARRLQPDTFQPRVLVSKDPPEHTALRKLMQKAFTPKRVAALEPFVVATAHELIDAFSPRGEADLMSEFANPLPLRVITRILGFEDVDGAALRQWTEDFLVLVTPARDGEGAAADDDTTERMTRVLDMREVTLELIEARRREPRDDVISAMVAVADADAVALTDGDLVTLALELALAGNDTTANLIAHMVGFLLEDRRQWDEVRADHTLIPAAVEEALRRRGSSKGLFRRATRDVELAGATIRAGDVVHVLFAAAGHDESYFPDPRRYDIHRPNARDHVSFGRWTHFCLGAPLARLEARVALESLLDRLPDLRPLGEARPEYAPTLTTQTILGYGVTFAPSAA